MPAYQPLTPAVFPVLLALADGDEHGYAIMKSVEEHTGGTLKMGAGTLYGTLQRLSDAAWSGRCDCSNGARDTIRGLRILLSRGH